jgi:hypothetical protein
MNQAANLPRVNPWIVVALAAALILLAVTALVLLIEPGIMQAIRSTLHGPSQVACSSQPIPC